jgi:hypothetical protein
MHMSSGFAILRIPTRPSHVSPPGLAPGPHDLYPMTVVKPLVGVSGFGVSQCMDFLSRDSRFSESRLAAIRTVGSHNGASLLSSVLTAGRTVVPSSLSGFFPMTPMLPLVHVTDSTVAPRYFLSLSRYRVSRFQVARLSCPQDLRYADFRLSSDF